MQYRHTVGLVRYASKLCWQYSGSRIKSKRHHIACFHATSSNAVSNVSPDVSKTRNIGIIAHIDAGKTTTTERMLYYSGHTRRIGNVDEGSTVTDFLPAERARGVTIQSAAISLNWPPLSSSGPKSSLTADLQTHNINLIDTPGHADFTFEVLRSLRILDGAVCILDGVAGVEAQTEKVWYQASKYAIPKIIYVNKLDREGAAFGAAVKQIAERLHTWPAVCQIPWWQKQGSTFVGIGDVIGTRAIRYAADSDGTDLSIIEMDELKNIDPGFAEEIIIARKALIEICGDNDEGMIDSFLQANEQPLEIPAADIIASLRRCVLDRNCYITPVFAGASFRNIGVQPLLDAIVQLLPSPDQAIDPDVRLDNHEGTLSELLSGKLMIASHTSNIASKKSLARHKRPSTGLIQVLEACALAFKVVYDARRGMLVYVRVYSGTMRKQSMLFNTNLQLSERAPQLLKMYASDSVQIDEIPAGQIGVITGLKHARTGDTLITYTGASPKTGPPAPLNALQLRPIDVPPAVFFSSIEPHSTSETKNVHSALEILVREDPSLTVTQDEESGQTLLSGMGEFHLEIARDRLINDFKAKASMGKIEIAYRECILQPSVVDTIEQATAGCRVQVQSIPPEGEHRPPEFDIEDQGSSTILQDGNRVTILIKPITPSSSDPTSPSQTASSAPLKLPETVPLHVLQSSLRNGVLSALSRGPNYAFSLHSTDVILTFDPTTFDLHNNTTAASLSSAARTATKGAIRSTALENGTSLMELVMLVTVSGLDESNLGTVVNDLSGNRGGNVIGLDDASSPQISPASTMSSNIDLDRVYAPRDPFGKMESGSTGGKGSGGQRSISARVPLKEMVGYLKHLRSLTGGRGTFVMAPERFERVVGMREKVLLKELRGY
ncbi:MAG: Ribosome-releasing factor 2, mitochondrial [Ramalina farinacea]|uniref:Ribosome-releasing factor 2, mitochondrial n=1 Tax=Ramalina farinacea TaxID=258253 RepID=A0AA43QXY4_9LECA|nr:Ribosome-releasing factor 2, mitochondrial [Ramalina farinacea]